MAILLWVRTTRHVNTLVNEIDDLRVSLIGYSNRSYDWLEPFQSGDQVLFGLRTDANIYSAKAFLAPEMKRDFIVDWSLTEVGQGLGPYDAHLGYKADGSQYYDDRFYDPEEETDEITEAADEIGYARLDWALPYDAQGATGLWVSLAREREDRDFIIAQIERSLPKPVQRLWQGRNSLLFAYTSGHDLKRPAPFGLTEELEGLLDRDEVAWYLAFQIGNISIGGAIENMNPMADWIWNRRKAQRHDRRPRTAGPKIQSHPVVVVEKRRPRMLPTKQ